MFPDSLVCACICIGVCLCAGRHSRVRVCANASVLPFSQVHLSLRGIGCCEMSDSAVVCGRPSHAAEEREKWR